MSIQEEIKSAILAAPPTNHFRVDERVVMRGNVSESVFTWIGYADNELALWEDGSDALPILPEFVDGVFQRYAQPITALGDITARLILHEGDQLLHMLYVPRFDVVPKDYLIWYPRHGEASVELCAHLVPPLRHLAQVKAQARLG